jgi:hypothetical protein
MEEICQAFFYPASDQTGVLVTTYSIYAGCAFSYGGRWKRGGRLSRRRDDLNGDYASRTKGAPKLQRET